RLGGAARWREVHRPRRAEGHPEEEAGPVRQMLRREAADLRPGPRNRAVRPVFHRGDSPQRRQGRTQVRHPGDRDSQVGPVPEETGQGGEEMTSPLLLARRALLRGAGATVALPLLEAMLPEAMGAPGGSATAPPPRPPTPPRRMAFVYVPNGKNMAEW